MSNVESIEVSVGSAIVVTDSTAVIDAKCATIRISDCAAIGIAIVAA